MGGDALPKAVYDQLTRIAETGSLGRRPSAAHPMCRCGRKTLIPCPVCRAGWGQPCRPDPDEGRALDPKLPRLHGPWLHRLRRHPVMGDPLLQLVRPEQCPVHANARHRKDI